MCQNAGRDGRSDGAATVSRYRGTDGRLSPSPAIAIVVPGGVAIIGPGGQTDGRTLITLTRYKAANIEN